MADDQIPPGQGKEAEDEMTVVVPPPKSTSLSGPPTKDSEGNVAMEDTEAVETDETTSEKVDPAAKAISGQCGYVAIEPCADYVKLMIANTQFCRHQS